MCHGLSVAVAGQWLLNSCGGAFGSVKEGVFVCRCASEDESGWLACTQSAETVCMCALCNSTRSAGMQCMQCVVLLNTEQAECSDVN